jgi:hypothetical protein
MTIEKNGQLAWTFEDIDFMGALEDLQIETKPLYASCHELYLLWNVAMDERNDVVADWLEAKRNVLVKRTDDLYQVSCYILNLNKGVGING